MLFAGREVRMDGLQCHAIKNKNRNHSLKLIQKTGI